MHDMIGRACVCMYVRTCVKKETEGTKKNPRIARGISISLCVKRANEG